MTGLALRRGVSVAAAAALVVGAALIDVSPASAGDDGALSGTIEFPAGTTGPQLEGAKVGARSWGSPSSLLFEGVITGFDAGDRTADFLITGLPDDDIYAVLFIAVEDSGLADGVIIDADPGVGEYPVLGQYITTAPFPQDPCDADHQPVIYCGEPIEVDRDDLRFKVQKRIVPSDLIVPASAPRVGVPITVQAPPWVTPGLTRSGQWYTYWWEFEAWTSPLAGQTTLRYTPTVGDIDSALWYCLTATRPGYQAHTECASPGGGAGVSPGTVKAKVSPSITGAAKVGAQLTAKPGTWEPSGANLTYLWYNGSKKVGSGATYRPTGADAGKRLTLTVIAKASGWSQTVVRVNSAVVAKGSFTPKKPTITGAPAVGKVLTAQHAAWAPASVKVTYRYTWLRDGKAISKATDRTYRVTQADRGKKISVSVRAVATGYEPSSTQTSASVKVPK